MTYDQIPGWFNYGPLYDSIVENAPDGSLFVEVGCWLGQSTAYLAKKIKESEKNIHLYAVDHGFGSPGGEDYKHHENVLKECGGNVAGWFVNNLKECDVLDVVTPIIAPSVKASVLFPNRSLQFVFIDGAHDPDSVLCDLTMWWPKVATGGVMAGHDYDGCWLGVMDTVDKYFAGSYRNFDLKDKDAPGCWSRKKVSAFGGPR